MPMKNYTTTIDAYQSLGEIQAALAKHGARRVMIHYGDGGAPQAVTFGIETPCGPQVFLLPANVSGVYEALKRQKARGFSQEQAFRTAWRNVRDWVLAQMAFIEAGNADLAEVFLPYLTDGRGHTAYMAYVAGRLQPLLGEGSTP